MSAGVIFIEQILTAFRLHATIVNQTLPAKRRGRKEIDTITSTGGYASGLEMQLGLERRTGERARNLHVSDWTRGDCGLRQRRRHCSQLSDAKQIFVNLDLRSASKWFIGCVWVSFSFTVSVLGEDYGVSPLVVIGRKVCKHQDVFRYFLNRFALRTGLPTCFRIILLLYGQRNFYANRFLT